MAFSFPLPTANFFDAMATVSAKPLSLLESRQHSQTASGEIIDASMGTRLWQGSITLRLRRHAEAAKYLALIQLLTHGGRTFYGYDKSHPYPYADPLGTILGASTPTISSLNANNRELDISGLPAGYVLTAGDFISFTYGSSPTRYALHQLVNDVTANGSGVASNIEVIPNIRPGAVTTTPVTLAKPYAKFLITPGSFTAGGADILFTSGVSFNFLQTLR